MLSTTNVRERFGISFRLGEPHSKHSHLDIRVPWNVGLGDGFDEQEQGMMTHAV